MRLTDKFMRTKLRLEPSTIFTLLIGLIMVVAVSIATGFPFLARIYPLIVGSLALVMVILLLARDFRHTSTGGISSSIDIKADHTMPASVLAKKAGGVFAWILCLYLGIWLVGFKIGVVAFFISYTKIKAGLRWPWILGLTMILISALIFFDRVLRVFWPSGLLEQLLGEFVPWLF